MIETWKRLAPAARTGLIAGAVLIVVLMAGLGFWAYRTDYQVLFADVAPADAASMTAELDKLKTPYQLADGGATILVPHELVYKTRLKLMGKELPLHGAVGFEVFNNADFGMTEFVQKVNYLRAIQGELTRTILSIEEIQAARVHLALPEQGLFKKAQTKPKASVTLTMKNGQTLAPEQITGIQRLVAASVPDIASGDVTVLNQHGVALTRVAAADGGDNGVSQLDGKRGTEEYLLRKVTQVLDRTYGAGQAVASVDVALNLDQSKVTTEEILPARNPDPAASPTGVVVRERSSAHEAGNAGSALAGSGKPGSPASSTSEFDYQVGRRVEQTVSASGGVKRMTVAVLVKQAMDEDQLARLKEVVALAVGINPQRGDAVVVYSMQALATPQMPPALAAAATAPAEASGEPAGVAAPPASAAAGGRVTAAVLGGLALLVVLAALAYALGARRRAPAAARLSEAEREQMLSQVRQWIATPSSAEMPGRRP